MAYWVIKTEPSTYSYENLEKERRTAWTGIRNPVARKNLRAMKAGDLLLFYHTGDAKEIVGVARAVSDPGPDPTAPGEDWAAVDVEPVKAMTKPVTLAELKKTPTMKDLALVKQGRLSVGPVSPEQFQKILEMGQTSLG